MADTKLSALSVVSSVVDADDIYTNESGTSKRITALLLKTYANTANVFAAGSATAGTWPKFTAGTLLTTAEDGALEMDGDCFYATTDAGNRGVVPVENLIISTATRTLNSDTLQQALFATGTLTLEVGTYLFEAFIGMDTMSATSGNGKWSLIGAGTATLAKILQFMHGVDNAFDASGTMGGSGTQLATQTSINYGAASAATEMILYVKGTFQVTGAGTIIPSFAQTTAAAAVVKIGSFFKCNRIGSTSVNTVGQWS